MKQLLRTALVAVSVVLATLPLAQQPPHRPCDWRGPVPKCLKAATPPTEAGFSYAGGFAFVVGGLSLFARAKRR